MGVTVIDFLFSCLMHQIPEGPGPPPWPPSGNPGALAARAEETRQTNIHVRNKKSLDYSKNYRNLAQYFSFKEIN